MRLPRSPPAAPGDARERDGEVPWPILCPPCAAEAPCVGEVWRRSEGEACCTYRVVVFLKRIQGVYGVFRGVLGVYMVYVHV